MIAGYCGRWEGLLFDLIIPVLSFSDAEDIFQVILLFNRLRIIFHCASLKWAILLLLLVGDARADEILLDS